MAIKLSDETKKKISNSLKGKIPKNIDLFLSKANRFQKGDSPWNKGKKTGHVPKTVFKKGNKPWNYGTAKPRIKTGRDTRFKKGQVAPMKGKKLPLERKETMSKYMKGRYIGEKSPLWKGGLSKINKLVRAMPEYTRWRSLVFERDNYTCQLCGKKGCYLEPHHKEKLAKLIKDNSIINVNLARDCLKLWDISNGITLCPDCHMIIDNHRRKFK